MQTTRAQEFNCSLTIPDMLRILFFLIASVTAGLRPEEELDSRSKLSAVAWSPYIAPMLATSSFEGSVVLWDTNTGQMMQVSQNLKRICGET